MLCWHVILHYTAVITFFPLLLGKTERKRKFLKGMNKKHRTQLKYNKHGRLKMQNWKISKMLQKEKKKEKEDSRIT